MIEVSEEWKETQQRAFLPESFVEITLSNVNAAVTATVSSNNEASFSNTANVVNNQNLEASGNYALLEHNMWVLDGWTGLRSIMSSIDDYVPPGYVSANDGDTTLTIMVDNVTTLIPGLEITWSSEYNTYATNFTVEAKSGDSVVESVTVTNNTSNVSKLDLSLSDCDTIVITISDWSLPDQRRRVDSVTLGQTLVFGKNEIMSYSHEQSGDPLGTEITKNVIEFSVDNSDGRWNILNPTGMAKYLYERQKLDVRYGLTVNDTIEWVDVGTFYLSEWRTSPDGLTMNFVARDFVELLMSTIYGRVPLTGVVTEDCTILDMWGKDTDSVLSKDTTVTIYGSQVAKSGEIITTPTTDCLHMYHLADGMGYVVQKYIKLNENLYTDIRAAYKAAGVDLPWSYLSVLNKIAPSIEVPEQTAAEFIQKVVSSFAITMWFDRAEGKVMFYIPSKTLMDYVIPLDLSYKYPEVTLSKPLKRLGLTIHYRDFAETETYWYDVESDGDIITLDCPYFWQSISTLSTGDVIPYNLSYVVNRYKQWWGYRTNVSGEFRADPRLELFDVVTVETKYGAIAPVMITYLKYTYNGAFKCIYEGKVCGEIQT